MLETVQAFINRISEREHVLLLIANIVLTIHFVTKEQTISLFIDSGKVLLTNDLKITNNIEIHGECSSLKELIEGRDTLRMLMKRGDIRISASFRTLLLLESLFYLGKTEERLTTLT